MSTNYEEEQAEAKRQIEERLHNRRVQREKEIAEEKEREKQEEEYAKKIPEEWREQKRQEQINTSKKEYVPDSVLKQFAGFFLFLGVVFAFFFIPLGVPFLLIAGVLYFIDYNKRENVVEHVKEKAISVADEVKEKTLSAVQKKEEPNPDELLKWFDLKEKGVITEEEFEEHKKRILK